jgi:hypothetical protein
MQIKTHRAATLPSFIGATIIWYAKNSLIGRSRRSPGSGFLGYGLVFFLLCAIAAPIAKADAVNVVYSVTHVTGTEWQYNYLLSGSFLAGDDIAIFFPISSTSHLMTSGGSIPNWSTLVFQPDPLLPADGEFDIIANINDPSLTPTFNLSFLYTGPRVPGSQSFTVFDSNFNEIDTGSTTPAAPAIPEPSSFLLLASGLVSLVERAARKR